MKAIVLSLFLYFAFYHPTANAKDVYKMPKISFKSVKVKSRVKRANLKSEWNYRVQEIKQKTRAVASKVKGRNPSSDEVVFPRNWKWQKPAEI
jgi:hypothetical protein